jgi:hypothetical protein
MPKEKETDKLSSKMAVWRVGTSEGGGKKGKGVRG